MGTVSPAVNLPGQETDNLTSAGIKNVWIYISTYHLNSVVLKKKVKGHFYRAFSTLRPFGLLYSYPQQVPAFISRGGTHHTDAQDLYQRRRELLPMNFASRSVIYENPLGSFTCRKAGTWDILFYFPFEGSAY